MTKEEYMQTREDKTDMLEEFVEWRNKNGEDKPFMTVKVDYYRASVYNSRNGSSKPLTEKDSRIRVVTTKEKWIGSEKDPITSTTFEYL